MVEMNSLTTLGGIKIFLDCIIQDPLKRYGRFKTASGLFCRPVGPNLRGFPAGVKIGNHYYFFGGLFMDSGPDGGPHHILQECPPSGLVVCSGSI